ncbi:pleckstrin homology domain-containing family M member 1 isoform 2-T2 [Pholidichthys leucotaenia]
MIATQTADVPPQAKDFKKISQTLAQSLKVLQKRFVTSDEVVTSDDTDAHLLCCALEAVFIHGIRTKFIRSEPGGCSRKGDRGPLPQPFFWSLLKTVTHRDVIKEVEKITFVDTDVGRCRAWLRLALNHGLLECYLVSLFREDSKLRAHYQPFALLLDPEEREVLLSYLQGLSSLTFKLSYKSSVLNQWTTTPLALAGLCPLSQAEIPVLPLNGGDPPSTPACKEVWDTASQSSGSSDALDLQRGCPALSERGSEVLQEGSAAHHLSNLSLDTTGSSQLSSSLSSDSLLHGQDPRSSTGDQWLSCDLETPINVSVSVKKRQKDSRNDSRESSHSSQDSNHEDSLVSSTAPSQFSEMGIFSAGGTPGPATPPQDPADQEPNSDPLPTSPQLPEPTDYSLDSHCPPEVCTVSSAELQTGTDIKSEPRGAAECVEHIEAGQQSSVQESSEPYLEEKTETEASVKPRSGSLYQIPHRSVSILSTKSSLESESCPSWISEDDIYKPQLEQLPDSDESFSPAAEPSVPQSPPSVVHRRQIGLFNPFRGLLKLGHLERRSMRIWRDCYCELSPFEFRLYLNEEERTCCENCSLLRCEGVCLSSSSSSEGRFNLLFPGKKLALRAANRGEAEDWVERIHEAVVKCRPANPEEWEVLKSTDENGVDKRAAVSSPLSAPSSPEQGLSSENVSCLGQHIGLSSSSQELDWTRTTDVEMDTIKEAVLYLSTDSEARVWEPLVFSLTLEAFKGFQIEGGRKLQRLHYPIEEIRDVVPEVSLGSADFFKLLTVTEMLRLRAENPKEAQLWRSLIREALDSYRESGEDEAREGLAVGQEGVPGNLYKLVQHRLKEDAALLVHLCRVPSEKGLDTQNYKCAGCPQQIGPSLGRARLCEFSGQYYCDLCHRGDTSIIPSRMLHNWDLTQREVSKKTLRLLAQVQQEPLLNLEQLNPDLVHHAESMSQTHSLRQKLRILGDYLHTCRSRACKKLQERMGQRTYLLESSHLYSVMDLQQIADGQYVNFLLILVHMASNHVFHCDLCTQRGFICQICQANDIIFPFQFERTTRCTACKAVFHLSCKRLEQPCPRCERMKKYMERDFQY